MPHTHLHELSELVHCLEKDVLGLSNEQRAQRLMELLQITASLHPHTDADYEMAIDSLVLRACNLALLSRHRPDVRARPDRHEEAIGESA